MIRKLSIVLSFLMAYFIFPSAEAQVNNYIPETYVGINGGRTFSMMNFKPDVAQDILQGYQAGIVVRYISEKHLGLQVEFNYAQKGWQEMNDVYARRLDYIEMPFLTHIYFGRNFRFNVQLGPKIGYLFNEKILIDASPNSTREQHLKPAHNAFDYGFCAGLGFSLIIQQQVFQIDARAGYSLSDVFSNAKTEYFDNSNHMNASLSMAWMLKLK